MSDTVDVKRVLDMAGDLISTLKRNHMDEWTEVLQALVVVLNRKSVSLSGTIYLHDIFEKLRQCATILDKLLNANFILKYIYRQRFEQNLMSIDETRESINAEARKTDNLAGADYSDTITDPEGRAFWKTKIGSAYKVSTNDFMKQIAMKYTADKVAFNQKDLQKISEILDDLNTGFITSIKFNEFLKPFGPLSKTVEKVNSIVTQKYFFGFITATEAEELLYKQKVGTYILRFSRSSPGAFALAYVRETDAVSHVLIKPTANGGFETQNHTQTMGAVFSTLSDLLQCFSHRLKEPLKSSFLSETWFYGEQSTEDAERVLAGRSIGSFVVYKNSTPDSSAHFLISFIASTGVVHLAIYGDSSGVGLVLSGELRVFETLNDIVQAKRDIFRTPVPVDQRSRSISDAAPKRATNTPTEYGSLEFQMTPHRSVNGLKPLPSAPTAPGRVPPSHYGTISQAPAPAPKPTNYMTKPPIPTGATRTPPPPPAKGYQSIPEEASTPQRSPRDSFSQTSFPTKEFSMGNVGMLSGDILLGDNGSAVVMLPTSFSSIYVDYSYQVTCVGSYAPIYVEEGVSKKTFTIFGGNSKMRVSWQVTGRKPSSM